MPQFTYVEMVCELNEEFFNDRIPVEGIVVETLKDRDPEILFECYAKTFQKGDAKFFHLQTEDEQKSYYKNELGFPDVLQIPASGLYKKADEIIGFALVMPYLKNNYHISCMCILPDYQDFGIGKAMLNRIKNAALKSGCTTLTLGTETEMKAFHFYKEHGFKVTQEHIVYI